MSDPIDIAVARAGQKQRFGGRIQLPSGEVAMVDLPVPFAAPDALALISAIAEAFVNAPTQTEPPSRIIVPRH
jgi:hypothetical protein